MAIHVQTELIHPQFHSQCDDCPEYLWLQVTKLFASSHPITADIIPFVGVGGEEVNCETYIKRMKYLQGCGDFTLGGKRKGCKGGARQDKGGGMRWKHSINTTTN